VEKVGFKLGVITKRNFLVIENELLIFLCNLHIINLNNNKHANNSAAAVCWSGCC